MTTLILTTKLLIPQLRPNTIPRTRLIDQLRARVNHKLTLISASAGFGKTTLAAEWLSAEKRPVAWITLDDSDNDPARFLAYLVAALSKVESQVGQATLALLGSPQPPPPDILMITLLNEMAAIPRSFILAIDDYHLIQTPAIHQQLAFIVEHQPAQMHLVILTREDPPLPLPRLRAGQEMIEIRQNDLRFTQQEIALFLGSMLGREIPPEEVSALEQHTEGWIAGLQLAALYLQGRDDIRSLVTEFTGSSHYVLDYLMEEVFSQQSVELQDFLLKTSVLDRMCSPLCDAVTGRAGSGDLLERLEHTNLFIVPLDQTRTWYRYHHLFADLLRQRLHTTGMIPITELHTLASQWFLAEGFFPEAIQHALVACDWEKAAAIIQDYSVTLLRRGELMTLLGWLSVLPDETIYRRPLLARDYGWALSLTGQIDTADIYLCQAESVAGDDQDLLGTILVARAYNLRVRGDNLGAIEYARRALEILPPADALSIGLVMLTLGLAYWNSGAYQESERAFLEVDRAAQHSRNHYARLTALAYRGMIQAVYGHLNQAAELCQQVIQLGGQSPPVAPAHIALGALFYEWNQPESAIEHLKIGIEQSQRTGNPLIQSDGYRTLAVVQLNLGNLQAAISTLQQADQLAEDHQVSSLARMRNAACHVVIALSQGDLAATQIWAQQVTEPTDTSLLFPCLWLTPVRILLACNQRTEAADLLKELYVTACQKSCGIGIVEVRALQALASENPEDAFHFLQDALRVAQPGGFIRTFVDKGQPMKALLDRMKSQGRELKPYILTILAAFREPGGISTSQTLVEPVSERELEILHLISEGLSNREIAARLIIGLGTTKSHVHHILEKLGCQNRTQAAAKARELGLL